MVAPQACEAHETDRSAKDQDPSDRLRDFAPRNAQYRAASSQGNRECRAAAADPPEYIHARRLATVDMPERLRSVPVRGSNQDVAGTISFFWTTLALSPRGP